MDSAGSSRLAEEADFKLGEMEISPSGLEIRCREKREAVQPRVMQVLIALVRADGAVVSRDELIRQCWGGRIVSDDSINRCVVKIRQLAELGGAKAFEIETVPRIGYRLLQAAETSAPHTDAARSAAIDLASATLREERHGRWRRVTALEAVLVATGAVVILGLWGLWPRAAGQWTVTGSELLVATSLIERYPALSPDGKMIAYSAGTDIETRKIYLRSTAGGDPLRLTDDNYDDASPSWSPDGRQIAYVAYKQGEACRLIIAPAPAGPSREVGRCHSDERSQVAWAASGEGLFFLDRPSAKSVDRVMLFDLASGRASEVTHPPAGTLGDEVALPSPDGHWLAFSRASDFVNHQWIVLDLKSGATRVLIRKIGGNYAAWSSDSRTLFANLDIGTDHSVWAVPLGGGKPSRILSSPEETGRMSAGTNGLLAVELHILNDGLARTSSGESRGPTYLDTEKEFVATPDVAPDGSIVAAIYRPGDLGIWVLPRNGKLHKLVSLPGVQVEGEPRWSPDSSRIAFGIGPGANAIRIVTSSGAAVAAVPFRGSGVGAPAWTADGRAIVFPGLDQKGWRLWRFEIAHPEKLQATSYSGWITVRFRGTELYGVRYDAPGVWRIDGIPRRITQKPSSAEDNQWAIAGNEIAYVDDPFGKRRQVMVQPIASGSEHVLAQVPNYAAINGFAVDPSDNSVVYTVTLNSDTDIELLHLNYN